MLETEGIMLVQNEDGTFSEYGDSNDITISCENEEQCEEVVELLKIQLKPVKPIILDALNGDIDYECPLCGRQAMADAEGIDKYCGECVVNLIGVKLIHDRRRKWTAVQQNQTLT